MRNERILFYIMGDEMTLNLGLENEDVVLYWEAWEAEDYEECASIYYDYRYESEEC